MSNLNEEIKDICRLADAVIQNPSLTVATTAGNIGVCSAIATAAAGGALVFSPILAGLFGPIGVAVATVMLLKNKKNKEKEQQEKERMLREVISKQQAVINKLEDELAKSRQQNAKNKQEIENLKKMLRLLEDAEEQLRVA